MALLRKQARVEFVSEKHGYRAVFRPVYQEQIDAMRFATLPKIKKILETGEGDFDEYLAIGMKPYEIASKALIGFYGVKFEESSDPVDLENLSSDDAMEYLVQLADQDAEFRHFVKALADGQKKTFIAT